MFSGLGEGINCLLSPSASSNVIYNNLYYKVQFHLRFHLLLKQGREIAQLNLSLTMATDFGHLVLYGD